MQPREHDKNSTLRLAYSVDGAAEAISISRARLYELIAAGEIGICKIGKRTLIPASELTAFLERHIAPRTRPPSQEER